MPRGKYDRKESKIRRLESEMQQAKTTERKLREELERSKATLYMSKKSAGPVSKPKEVVAAPAGGDFLLRNNLNVLSTVRKQLIESDQLDESMLASIDDEIKAHVRLLGGIRKEVFHDEAAVAAAAKSPPHAFTSVFPYNAPSAAAAGGVPHNSAH